MDKQVVINKLCLEKELVGYRFDIIEDYKKLVSLDVDKKYVNYMIKAIGKNNIKKGVIIEGFIENNLFVTSNEENVVEVTNKNQAESILEKYFFMSDSDVNNILNGVNKTEEERVKSLIKGHVDTLEKTEFGYCKPIQSDYNIIVNALKGINNNLHVNEYQDKSSGELVIDVNVLTRKESLKVFYGLGNSKKLGKVTLDVSSGDRTYEKVEVDFNDSVEKFLGILENHITDTIFEVVYDREIITRCYCDDEGYNVFHHSIPIPGYNEEKYFDRDDLLKKYNLA